MKAISRFCVAIVLGWSACGPATACTTAVISGRLTVDGRPLLWKNRDRAFVHNEVIRLAGGTYQAIAVVNAGQRTTVWMGVNEAGFCIENSLSNDLRDSQATGPGNGQMMYEALRTCATVADFRELLDRTNATGRTTRANFGVIDAHGGAAIFETGSRSFLMFDANDPTVAPHGYIVRSNFSFTGQGLTESQPPEALTEIYSANRYLRAQELLNAKITREEKIDVAYLLRHCTRDLADDEGCCIPGSVNDRSDALPEFVNTKNTISRTTTVSAAVFQGVSPGDQPEWTTMWIAIGDPKFSVAVPCWPTVPIAPELSGVQERTLTRSSQRLREIYFDEARGGIVSQDLPEVWRQLWRVEDSLLSRTNAETAGDRTRPVPLSDLTRLHRTAAEQAFTVIERQSQRRAGTLEKP